MRTTARKFQDRWEFGLVSDKSYMTYLSVSVIALLVGIAFLLPGPAIKGFVQNALAGSSASSSEEPVLQSARVVLEGYPLYVSQCARCHGLTGEGDGPGAKSWTFSTVPRNLTAGNYRFVSTANGVASNDDLRRVITNGLTSSGMPAFNSLSEHQVQSLVSVLGFLWKDRPTTVEPITVPARPASTAAMVAEGKRHFGENCASCHGAGGRGDGPAADVIKDSFGNHIPPRNLVSDTIRGGASPAQLYVRIAAGIPDGKDHWLMPQFRDLGPEKIWALVSYLEAEILPRRKSSDAARTAAR